MVHSYNYGRISHRLYRVNCNKRLINGTLRQAELLLSVICRHLHQRLKCIGSANGYGVFSVRAGGFL